MASGPRFVQRATNKRQIRIPKNTKPGLPIIKNIVGKKYDGSCGNMEVSIAQELWKRSVVFKMRYKYMVCDGDSKACNSVSDVYGCCKTCKKYENMDRQSKEYEKWVNSKAYARTALVMYRKDLELL